MRPLRSASICVITPTYSSGTSIVEALDRLVTDAVDLADDDLGLADGQLEALAAHDLDEDRELQLAAALDLPRVRALGVVHADRDVADQLRPQAVLDLAGGELVAVLAGQRRGLMPIVTEIDGSSTVMTGSGRGSSRSASVSPIVTSACPATAMISPGPASAASTRSSASVM